MKITIDFETRSACEIWEAGAWQYSKHPSTEILCLAYAIDDGPVQILRKEEIRQSTFPTTISKDAIFVAHNSYFERCIWQNILVEKYGWPRVPINRWRCTMAKGLAHSLPASLKNMGAALNAPIQKSDEGHRVMMKLCKPDKNGNWNEDPKDLEQLYNYCINDVEAERAIDNMVPDLISQEQTIWFLDQLINDRGVYVDRPAIKKSLEFIKVHTETLNNYVADVTGGVLGGVSRRMAVMDWCKSQGVDIKGYSKSDVNDTLRQDVPEVVRAVLETKLSLGKTSVAKYQAMENSVGDDNRIRDLFVYHGANTGRWTGKLIQLHNLPKGNLKDTETAISLLKKESYEMFSIFYPDVMDTLSACIRGMIISPPGYDLLVADYSAIEARVVMWLADEKYGLSQFEKGVDLYVDMAKVIYNRQDISKGQRQLGKAAILGCIAEGSLVYSDKGFIPIETLNQGQRLWDGEQWVNFRELVPTGKKNVIQIGDLWLTPDHRLLTRRGWRTSAEIVLDGDTQPLILGQYSEDGRLLAENITSVLNVVSLSVVSAELKKIKELTDFGEALHLCVTDVIKASPENKGVNPVNIIISSLTNAYVNDGASVGGIFVDAVKTRITPTSNGMGLEVFPYPSSLVEISWNMLLHWMGLTNGVSHLIELIMPKGTREEILDSLLKESTIETKVKECYDIAETTNNRFQLQGYVAHNCGYGMGPDKFHATCLAWGIPVDKQLASKAIETYRRVYASVTRSWYAQEAAAISAIRDKQSVVCGRIRWELDDTTLLAILPSGRSLKYNGASLDYVETPWGERKLALHYMGLKKIQGQTTTKWERQHTYGGKLVENITQAVARDLLAAAMLRAEAVGYKVAFSVHDEIVSEVPEGFGSVEEFEKILCKKPSWALGCPIEAKGFRTKRYRKD